VSTDACPRAQEVDPDLERSVVGHVPDSFPKDALPFGNVSTGTLRLDR